MVGVPNLFGLLCCCMYNAQVSGTKLWGLDKLQKTAVEFGSFASFWTLMDIIFGSSINRSSFLILGVRAFNIIYCRNEDNPIIHSLGLKNWTPPVELRYELSWLKERFALSWSWSNQTSLFHRKTHFINLECTKNICIFKKVHQTILNW